MATEAPAPGGSGPAGSGSAAAEPRHGLRLLITWVVASVIGCVLVYAVWGPHLPPGRMSSSAANQQLDNRLLGTLATPVLLGVLIYFGYALTFWRAKDGDETDGPPIHGNTKVQLTWIAVTTTIVLALAVFGTVELVTVQGAGAGEGPQPIWKPTVGVLQVQVIGQQWAWTYRYPQFGGFETTQLELPVNKPVQFNVTSLDVIHDFWAYQLGVKADANPGVNNVAYTTATHTGSFTVRCAELCGLWHGEMYNYGKVVSVAAFQAWAQQTQTQLASLTKELPPYAMTYDPTNIANLGKVLGQLGIGGAGGGYYNPNDPEQP
ncbi:MAG: cytochrome c oxidase subunit II [Actinomycetota bacterium]|nr:cytochrome c oxidase subunit II [Actinomycetota bacterium]